jgi:hypothetical protein
MPAPDEPIRYSPKVFDVETVEDARSIILQAETPDRVARRWEIETIAVPPRPGRGDHAPPLSLAVRGSFAGWH